MGSEGRRGKVDSTLTEGSSSMIGGIVTLIEYVGGRDGSEALPIVA